MNPVIANIFSFLINDILPTPTQNLAVSTFSHPHSEQIFFESSKSIIYSINKYILPVPLKTNLQKDIIYKLIIFELNNNIYKINMVYLTWILI